MAPLSEALQEAPGSLGTVRNAVLLLDLLADGPAYQQLTELADRSGLTLPTVHRLLRSLVLAGLVVQDPRSSRYGLGPQLVRLAHLYLARLPVLGALAPYLAQVRDGTQATVRVLLLVGTHLVEGDRAELADPGIYRDPVAVRPALATAAGRALAARADDERWRKVLGEAEDAVRAEASTERASWAGAEWLELAGPHTIEVAVPVVDPAGVAVAALAVDLPPDSDSDRIHAVAAQLRRAVIAAQRALGHG